MIDNTGARRNTNKVNAILLAKLGVAVFPSSGKVPLIPRFNKLDTEISPEDREAIVAEYLKEHDREPKFIGSTKDPEVVKQMWRAHPDAVPSIACGPSKLVVLDADQKDNGPELLGALFEEHGGVPDGVFVGTTRSGGKHFVFADPEGRFTNKSGVLGEKYGSDVRGTGGQFVAPGSIRQDGKTYGTRADLAEFCRAFANKSMPTLPAFISDLIGASHAPDKEQVTPSKEREAIDALGNNDWPEYDEVFDPTLGKYDLDLAREDTEFAKLYDNPSDDCSTNRFLAARAIMRQWPDMLVEELAVFFENWEGSGTIVHDEKPKTGEYDFRQIAREWIKNQGLSKPSTGEAFADLSAEVAREDAEYERHVKGEDIDEATPESLAPDMAAPKPGDVYFMRDFAIYNEPNWIVENVFTPGMLGMIHGSSNVGKTFSVIYLGEHIEAGDSWFIRNVEQSGCLYCYGEGHDGLRNRGVAYREKYKSVNYGMSVHPGIPNLGMDTGRAIKELRRAIKKANKQREGAGLKPIRVVFLDTFAKAIAGAQENDSAAVQPILNALRALAAEMQVCIILIHHSGKDTMLGARGSSALIADVDFNLEIINADEAKKRKITLTKGHLLMLAPKMRDGNKDMRIEFKLEEMTLGTNKWGNPVTSMVVVPVGAPSSGEAFGEVSDDDAPATSDELTSDLNRQAEEKRISFCNSVIEAMRPISKLVDGRMQVTVDEVAERLPALAKLKLDHGTNNFARSIRLYLMGGEPSVLLPDGRLTYVPASGRKNSLFTFANRQRTSST
jgi:hypothetical protein